MLIHVPHHVVYVDFSAIIFGNYNLEHMESGEIVKKIQHTYYYCLNYCVNNKHEEDCKSPECTNLILTKSAFFNFTPKRIMYVVVKGNSYTYLVLNY